MPKIIFLFILLMGVGVGVYLIGQRNGFFSRADASLAPVNPQVTNLSDNSFTVSWTTTKKTTGYLALGEGSSVVTDDRDTKGQIDRYSHHVTIKNLDPEQVYHYKIVSGGKSYDALGKPYTVTTAPVVENAPQISDPLVGHVEGGGEGDVLVYLKVGDNTTLSSYTRKGQNWLITPSNARTPDLQSYASISIGETAKLTVTSGVASLEKIFKLSDKQSVASLKLSDGESKVERVIASSVVSTPSKGVLDTVDCNVISGWTCDSDDYNKSLDVHIYDGLAATGSIATSGLADRARPDLKSAPNTCNGTTRHGFEFPFPESLKDGKEHTLNAYGINFPASSEGNSQLWVERSKKVTCSPAQAIKASLSGPTTGKVGQTIAAGSFKSKISADKGIKAVGIVLYKEASDNWSCPYPSPVVEGVKYCFIQAIDNPVGTTAEVLSKAWTPDKPGNYQVIIDVIDNTDKKCSGSHNRAVSDYDCGVDDAVNLNIN